MRLFFSFLMSPFYRIISDAVLITWRSLRSDEKALRRPLLRLNAALLDHVLGRLGAEAPEKKREKEGLLTRR
jgi:hypothetical protein